MACVVFESVDERYIDTNEDAARLRAYARAPGPIYEYACHEGNYVLPNVLRGVRARKQ
jgi:hypothetical protein